MRQRLTSLALIGMALASTNLHDSGRSALATPANGYATARVATGHFGEIDLISAAHAPDPGDADKTRSSRSGMQSDLIVQRNIWQPGGDTGWHSHPGRSLIIVTRGTVMDYESDDPHCTPHMYTKGMGFVDFGGSHVHIIRNESDTEAETIAVQFIPTGAPRRIDMPSPPNCRF